MSYCYLCDPPLNVDEIRRQTAIKQLLKMRTNCDSSLVRNCLKLLNTPHASNLHLKHLCSIINYTGGVEGTNT